MEMSISFYAFDLQVGNGKMITTGKAEPIPTTFTYTGQAVPIFVLMCDGMANMYGRAAKSAAYKPSSNTTPKTRSYNAPPTRESAPVSTTTAATTDGNINLVGSWQSAGELIEFTEAGFFHLFTSDWGHTYGTYGVHNGQVQFSMWPNASGEITNVTEFAMNLTQSSSNEIQLANPGQAPVSYSFQGNHSLTKEDIAMLVNMSQTIHGVNMNIINGINNDYRYVETDEYGNPKW